MTSAVDEPTTEQPAAKQHSVSHHTRENTRRDIMLGAMLVVLGIVMSIAFGVLLTQRQQRVETRAENALVALEQACDQVAQLGGQCVTEASEVTDKPESMPGLPGKDGLPGPSGRPPTPAELDAAVARYLQANPPPPGPAGEDGADGAPGGITSGCPSGTHLDSVTVDPQGPIRSVTFLACVAD